IGCPEPTKELSPDVSPQTRCDAYNYAAALDTQTAARAFANWGLEALHDDGVDYTKGPFAVPAHAFFKRATDLDGSSAVLNGQIGDAWLLTAPETEAAIPFYDEAEGFYRREAELNYASTFDIAYMGRFLTLVAICLQEQKQIPSVNSC